MKSAILIPAASLALVLIGLGFIPWSKTGTPWRPDRRALEAAAGEHWNPHLIEKGREFRSGGYGRYFLRKGLAGLLLVVILALGWHRWLRQVPGGTSLPGAVIGLLAVFLILDLLYVPFGLKALASAREFGISKQSVGFWFADHLKGLGVSLLVTAVVAGVLFFLVKHLPRAWPLPATLLAGAGGVAAAFLVPLVVDPLFNKFTPLGDESLKSRFLDIAARAGIPAREVLVSDASIRTTAVNAYFTGFGPTKRIVVYDTLVETLTPGEAGLVLAHEAGHWSLGHIVKGILLGTLGAGFGLWLAGMLLGAVFRAGAFGLIGPLDPAAAPLFLLLYWLGTFASLPVENAVSRGMESQADRFALELTGDALTQIRVEEALAEKNLADVIPPPVVEALLYTHPNTMDRIEQARDYRARHPGADERR